jgi:hypothetical protein
MCSYNLLGKRWLGFVTALYVQIAAVSALQVAETVGSQGRQAQAAYSSEATKNIGGIRLTERREVVVTDGATAESENQLKPLLHQRDDRGAVALIMVAHDAQKRAESELGSDSSRMIVIAAFLGAFTCACFFIVTSFRDLLEDKPKNGGIDNGVEAAEIRTGIISRPNGAAAKLLRSSAAASQLLGSTSTLHTRVSIDTGRDTISTNMSSPLGSAWLNRSCTPAKPLSLPTPLVVKAKEGEAFVLNGPLLPKRQESQIIDIQRVAGREVVARIHISEDDKGSGILMEFVDTKAFLYPLVVPFAFLDTAFAAPGRIEATIRDRQVSVFGASEVGFDAAALPTAIIKATTSDRLAMVLNGQVVLSVVTKPSPSGHQLSHVEGKDGRLATIQSGGASAPLTLQCASGADAGLILCAVVASIKLL